MPSTWTSKAMWKAVAYVIILDAASQIAVHHLMSKAWYDNVPAELQMGSSEDQIDSNRDFYFNSFPRDIILTLVLTPIAYQWQCWLERMLPGRARGAQSTKTSNEKPLLEKAGAESDEEFEEEMMRRLIAKGKVQRSSLSWFNTLLKWLLDNIVGAEFFGLCRAAFENAWARRSQKVIWLNMKESLWTTPLMRFISPQPLISLLSFIIIPVQHRLTFDAAAALTFDVFVGAFLIVLVPWLMTKEWALEIIRNASEASRATLNGTTVTVTWLEPTDGVSVDL